MKATQEYLYITPHKVVGAFETVDEILLGKAT